MFGLYASILSNYKFALDVLNHEKKRNKKLVAFLDRTTNTLIKDKHRLTTLESYLITPAQRLPRYMLLLTDMLRMLNEGTSAYNELSEATKAMNNVIRTSMVEVISYQRMLDACKIFCHGKFREMCRYILPHRRLIAQEVNSNVHVDMNEGREPCDLFLLTDLLIIQMKNRKCSKVIALRKGDYCPETGFIIKTVEVKIIDDKNFIVACNYEENDAKKMYTCLICDNNEQMERLSGGLSKCLSHEASSRRSNSHLRGRSSEKCVVM
jgi:hypothetical protein